jgi:predicted nucleotidyltransferase
MQVEGTALPVANVEDLLVYKAVASRERDQRDIRELLALYSGELDLERVRRIVGEFAEAIDEPERVSTLEQLIRESPSRRK